MAQWPFTGREAELTALRSALAGERGGVLLAGPAGVGKTRLATSLLDHARDQGAAVLRIAATASATDVPFGAFAAVLPDLTPGATRAQMLRDMARAVAGRDREQQVVVLVDDVHLLDELSASLVHQLVLGTSVFVIATIRSESSAPDAIQALWKDGLVDRHDIKPLTREATDQLVTAALGERVEARTLRSLHERCAGNVLFLRELVASALDAEVLSAGPHGWALTDQIPSSSRLIELVDARIGNLDDADRHALELIALGEPLRDDVLQRVGGVGCTDTLHRHRLVREDRTGNRPLLRLAHPIYGDVVRALLSSTRTRTLYQQLADALEDCGPSGPDDALRLATWRLDSGAETDARTMYAGAERAWNLHELRLADRLARAAVTAGHGFEAQLLLGQVLCAAGCADEAEQHLQALTPADDAELTRLTITRLDNLGYSLGRLDTALTLAEDTTHRLTDPSRRDELAAHRASLLDTAGRTTDALGLALPLTTSPDPNTRMWAAVIASLELAKTGQLEQALTICDAGFATFHGLTEAPLQWGVTSLAATHCWALHFSGRLAEAESAALETLERGTRDGASEPEFVMGAVLAMVNIAQGKPVTAAHRARQAADLARTHGRLIHTRLALLALVEALAVQGHEESAAHALAELDATEEPQVRMLAAEVLRVRAWARVASGEHTDAADLFTRAAESAQRNGDRVFALAAWHDLARIGQPRAAAPGATESATAIDGPWAQARALHVTGLAAGDPMLLVEACDSFASIGALLLATEAVTAAAVAHERHGQRRPAQAARNRAAQLRAKCEEVHTPALATDITVQATLTPRETEIARLAAEGHSDKDIGRRLYISHRTVENRLQRVYTKLGITSRQELSAAIADGCTGP